MKSAKYYLERAEYMRTLAKSAQTESLRNGCLKAEQAYLALAESATKLTDHTEETE